MENSALCNLKLSLENNRAHLQKQLNTRESEINRLAVKLRVCKYKAFNEFYIIQFNRLLIVKQRDLNWN